MPTDAVDWELAQRVAARVSGADPFQGSYQLDSLVPDFEELTAEAEELVARETGLRSSAGPARVRVTDRQGWVTANVRSFKRLLGPLTDRLLRTRDGAPKRGPGVVSSRVAGVEVGTMLGWMSTRVLGQYDLLLLEDEDPLDQDLVYYVGTNVLSLERRYAFPPREFRLWLALHETTHRAQFTGVPWLAPYYRSLVEGIVASVDPDPARLADALRRAVAETRAGHNPLDDGGLIGLLANESQRGTLEKVGGLMALLEGHGDVTMDRAGADRIPSAERFSRVLRARRAASPGPARIVRKLVGFEAKLRQYELGEAFIAAVEDAGGPQLVAEVWNGPENLPNMSEIRAPGSWIERMGASPVSRPVPAG
ncbi:MAG TPA: zinc-dependent metalloprotease [Acidimicrobiales bacterium]